MFGEKEGGKRMSSIGIFLLGGVKRIALCSTLQVIVYEAVGRRGRGVCRGPKRPA